MEKALSGNLLDQDSESLFHLIFRTEECFVIHCNHYYQ